MLIFKPDSSIVEYVLHRQTPFVLYSLVGRISDTDVAHVNIMKSSAA